MVAVRHRLPGPDVGRIRRRHPETAALKTYLSTAPVRTQRTTSARISGMHWPIETRFEDRQPWLGMGDDEVRCWTGWYHHLRLVLLAHFWGVRTMLTME